MRCILVFSISLLLLTSCISESERANISLMVDESISSRNSSSSSSSPSSSISDRAASSLASSASQASSSSSVSSSSPPVNSPESSVSSSQPSSSSSVDVPEYTSYLTDEEWASIEAWFKSLPEDEQEAFYYAMKALSEAVADLNASMEERRSEFRRQLDDLVIDSSPIVVRAPDLKSNDGSYYWQDEENIPDFSGIIQPNPYDAQGDGDAGSDGSDFLIPEYSQPENNFEFDVPPFPIP